MAPAQIWEEVYQKNRFGVKNGAGFYNYGGEENDRTVEHLLAGIQKKASAPGTKKAPFSANRLLMAMINEAALCLQEKVASPADIDVAVLAGIGFPQAKGGLLQFADELGIDAVLQELDSLHKLYGDRFWPAPVIRQMVLAGFLGKKTKRGFLEYA